jgi:isopenicillin N synthase-like dioxygenase
MTRKAIEPVSMSLHDSDFQAFADRLGSSFKRYGFAVIADHGLDESVIDAAVADTKAFFALPDETKRQYHLPGTGGARGLTPFGVEAAKGAATVDLKEFWHVGRELPAGHPYRKYMRDNVWPTEIEGFAHDPAASVTRFRVRPFQVVTVRADLAGEVS